MVYAMWAYSISNVCKLMYGLITVVWLMEFNSILPSLGLEFSPERHHENLDSEGACGEITCRYGRIGVNVTRIRMSKVKVLGREGQTLAELTSETPSVNSNLEEYEITGDLAPGRLGGKIEVRLLSPSDCETGLFSCDVTYDDEEGHDKTDTAFMGQLLPVEEPDDSIISSHNPSDSCFRLDAVFSERTSRMERSFDYKINRIQQMYMKKDDFMSEKLAEVERSLGSKLTGMESRFEGRYTRLDKDNGDLSEQMRLVERTVNQEVATCSSQYADIQERLVQISKVQDGVVSEMRNKVNDVMGRTQNSRLNNHECQNSLHNFVGMNNL